MLAFHRFFRPFPSLHFLSLSVCVFVCKGNGVLIPVTLVVIGPCIVDGSSKIIERQTLPAIMIPENLKILFQLGLKNLFIGSLPIQGIRLKNDILRGLLFQSLGQKTLCIIKMLAAGSADITCIAVLIAISSSNFRSAHSCSICIFKVGR